MSDSGGMGGFSLLELFKLEAETHCAALSDGLLTLERSPGEVSVVEPLMRAAHSIKGAAKRVGSGSWQGNRGRRRQRRWQRGVVRFFRLHSVSGCGGREWRGVFSDCSGGDTPRCGACSRAVHGRSGARACTLLRCWGRHSEES